MDLHLDLCTLSSAPNTAPASWAARGSLSRLIWDVDLCSVFRGALVSHSLGQWGREDERALGWPCSLGMVTPVSEPQMLCASQLSRITDLAINDLYNPSACQRRRRRRLGFDPWVRKIPWRRKQQPTPVFLMGKPKDREAWRARVHVVAKSDMTEVTERARAHTHKRTQARRYYQLTACLLLPRSS